MTREEAYSILHNGLANAPSEHDWCMAFDMAIQALKQEPCEDCVNSEYKVSDDDKLLESAKQICKIAKIKSFDDLGEKQSEEIILGLLKTVLGVESEELTEKEKAILKYLLKIGDIMACPLNGIRFRIVYKEDENVNSYEIKDIAEKLGIDL